MSARRLAADLIAVCGPDSSDPAASVHPAVVAAGADPVERAEPRPDAIGAGPVEQV